MDTQKQFQALVNTQKQVKNTCEHPQKRFQALVNTQRTVFQALVFFRQWLIFQNLQLVPDIIVALQVRLTGVWAGALV